VFEIAVLPVFEVAESELVGPPVKSGWVPAVPALLESELVCALAGKASITARRGAITKLRKCLGEASRHMPFARPGAATRPRSKLASEE